MRNHVKIFAIIAVLYAVSTLPVNEPHVDLLAADSSPITDSEDSGDELMRHKRHGLYGNYLRTVLSGETI